MLAGRRPLARPPSGCAWLWAAEDRSFRPGGGCSRLRGETSLAGPCAGGWGEASPTAQAVGRTEKQSIRFTSHHKEALILRIYPLSLQVAADAARAAERIARKDPALARQLRRASVSVPLNIAEVSRARGRNRTARYSDALGSALETRACYDVAAAVGYLPAPSEESAGRLRRVIGTLVNLTR